VHAPPRRQRDVEELAFIIAIAVVATLLLAQLVLHRLL
jgi:hypothetical protein